MPGKKADNDKNRRALIETLMESPAYKIAYEDIPFLDEDEQRPIRLQLELQKPEVRLREHNIQSTIVVFGSARTMPPDRAKKQLKDLLEKQKKKPTAKLKREVTRAKKQLEHSRYYEEARLFSKLVSQEFMDNHRKDFVIVTGGGPGVMEAANRGAHDVNQMSAGLNITLPMEQRPNPYISPELCFRFRYFAIRKMHFLMRAKALVAFPGGYGTMDELFEALCLVQTRKMPKMPIVLVGRDWWQKLINWDFFVEEGVIDAEDLELFHMVDTAQEAMDVIYSFYGGGVPRRPKTSERGRQ